MVSPTFSILSLVTVVTLSISLYSNTWFYFHPLLMLVSYGLGMSNAIYLQKNIKNLKLHYGLQFLSLVTSYLGLYVIYKNKNFLNEKHFSSMHGKLGLLLTLLFTLMALVGYISMNFKFSFGKPHKYAGRLIFVLGLIQLLLGIFSMIPESYLILSLFSVVTLPAIYFIFPKIKFKVVQGTLTSEERTLAKISKIEKSFQTNIKKIKDKYVALFKKTPPSTELKQLFDICCKICTNVLSLEKCHEKLNFKEHHIFDLDKENTEIYSKYLQTHRGMRSILHILSEQSQACEQFLSAIDHDETAAFSETCTLPALDIEKYLEIYQDWKCEHLNDDFGTVILTKAISNFQDFMKENESFINEIYQQEKFISIQKLTGINDLGSAAYTGTNTKARAEKYVYDGILEYENKSCQAFLFDKLLIISEATLSGRNNELIPVKIGEFSVVSIEDDQFAFEVIFNVDERKSFKAKDEESKKRWIKQLQGVSINHFIGERELMTNIREQSYIIDFPQSYYLQDITKMKKREITTPNTKEYIEFSENDFDIKCATFDKLIEKLTNPQAYDNLFLYAFLLTYRNFTTPVEVLKKLIERYNMPPPLSVDEFHTFKAKYLLPIRLRICQILKIWIVNHGSDFRNNKDLYRLLNEFMKEMDKTKIGIGAKQILKSIRTHIYKRDTFELQQLTAFSNDIQELEQYSSNNSSPNSKHNSLNITSLTSSPSTPKPIYPKKLMNPLQQILKHRSIDYQQKINTLDIIEWDPLEITRQLILIEYKIFERIQPKECLNQAWNKENRENKAPNIHDMIIRTNQIVNWISYEILKFEKLPQRQHALEVFVKVAIECKNLNAYNTLFEICGALNSISIHRLDKTWEGVNQKLKKEFEELSKLISRKKNYSLMRNELKLAIPPILPYIGLYLTDLTFIEDANKDILNDKINFSKCRKLAKVIRDIQNYQQKNYDFFSIVELSNKLRNINVFSEDQLIELSYKREPKEE